MSLKGYVKKGKPANWLGVAGAQPVRARAKAVKAAKSVIGKFWRSKDKPYLAAWAVKRRDKYLKLLATGSKPRKPIRPVSKRRQAVTEEYRKAARAFVRAAIKRGEVCPVWRAVKELHDGVKYGWQISGRLNEVHHTRGRAGTLLTDERHWIAVSKLGHRWIHEHPAEARARGWICAEGKWNTP